jgi:Flp pilus assembly protein TadG
MRNLNKSRHRGIGLLWLILFLMALIAVGGLAVDASRCYLASHQLQNAADSAALAGARYVAWDPDAGTKLTARQMAETFAGANQSGKLPVKVGLNESNAPEGDIVIGRYITQMRTFVPTTSAPNAMKVVARKDDTLNPGLPLVFGSLFGVNQSTMRKHAIAMIYNAAGAPVIATSTEETGIYLHGTPTINIGSGGSMYANTFDISADFRGNPGTEVAEINLAGDLSISGKNFNPNELSYAGLPATLNTNMPPIEDPFKDLPEPSSEGMPDLGTISASGTYSPGYYSGGMQVAEGQIHLQPGIYILDGTNKKGGLNLTGGVINAPGVMLFIKGGDVNVRGNTQLTLSAPTAGTYAGMAIYQSELNENSAIINGEGGLDITGALYFPNNHIYMTGSGDTIGTQLVAETIEMAGNGVINIPYTGSPKIADMSFIVE